MKKLKKQWKKIFIFRRDITEHRTGLINSLTTTSEQEKVTKLTDTDSIETLTTSIEDIFAIGEPQFSLTGTLNDGEIWLEGAEVSKDTYSNLYEIYGTNYGDAEDSDNFVLPDFRGRALWGYESEFGYIDAGLPNLYGTFRLKGTEGSSAVAGAFAAGSSGGSWGTGHENSSKNPLMTFDASTYNSIYGNSDTVQPPAIIVRVKTRYI